MNIPRDFRVGLPQVFGQLVGGWLSGKEPAEIHGLDGHWVRVKGGPVPVPVVVRIDRTPEGRFIVTGLLIGFGERREITWETLRLIKPATILNMIFSGFDPRDPARLYHESDPAPPRLVDGADFDVEQWQADEDDEDPLVVVGSPEYNAHIRALAALQLWEVTDGPEPEQVKEVTRPRASVATDLAAFAEIYLRNYAANARRATTATAQDLHISRATAIRRIAECREVGLLPRKNEARA